MECVIVNLVSTFEDQKLNKTEPVAIFDKKNNA